MSGGVAYVFTEDLDTFNRHCNQTLVEIDPVEEKDQKELHQLLTNHVEYTGSMPVLRNFLTIGMEI